MEEKEDEKEEEGGDRRDREIIQISGQWLLEIVGETRLAHGVVSYFKKKAAQRKHICMILKATQWSSSDHLNQNPTFPCNSVTLGKTLKLSPSFI